MNVDDFLGLENIPFIPYPIAGCAQCLAKYATETLAHSKVLDAYFVWQNARLNLISAYGDLPIAIGKTAGAALIVSTSGVTGLGGVVLGSFISQAVTCAQSFFGLSSGQTCVPNLKTTAKIVAAGASAFLPNPYPSFPTPTQIAVKSLLTAINTMLAAIDAAGNIIDAYGAEQAAYGLFQQSLGPYAKRERHIRRASVQQLAQCPLRHLLLTHREFPCL